MVGGGSGGHITPLLAVAEQLKKDKPDVSVYAVSERFGVFNHIFKRSSSVDRVHHVFAGKLRRYHNESWLKRLTDIQTILLNLKDGILLIIGFLESIILLLRLRPSVIFIKGGYVGVPLGFASRLLRIPYVTHDSDAMAGLTNKLIGPGAAKNAVGAVPEMYHYTPEKIIYTGVPIEKIYRAFSSAEYKNERSKLGIKSDEFLILILGGSNGAQRIDRIMHEALSDTLKKYPKIRIIQQVGSGNESMYADYPPELASRTITSRFLSPVSSYCKAADLVISRAGATAISELAALKKPVVLIPHPALTGGHQLHNAQMIDEAGAAIVISEKEALSSPKVMKDALDSLISSRTKRDKIAGNLHALSASDAAEKISRLLLQIGGNK